MKNKSKQTLSGEETHFPVSYTCSKPETNGIKFTQS